MKMMMGTFTLVICSHSRDSFEPADSTNEMEEVGEGETRGEEEAMEEEELVTSALTGSLPKEKVLEKILAHRVKENSDPPVHEFFVKWKVQMHRTLNKILHFSFCRTYTLNGSLKPSSKLLAWVVHD